MRGGALLKYLRLSFLLLAAALLSTAAWADGIDPKVIIQNGSGSIPITISNPDPTFGPVTATMNSHCLTPTDACVFEVFQNQTGHTLTHLTIAINDLPGFTFSCGSFLFFANCTSTDNESVTDVTFSGGSGIAPATQQCVHDSPASLEDLSWFLPGGCRVWDPDDFQFVGGEFGLLIDGTASENFNGQSVRGTAITPEPGSGMLILFGALAFGMFKLVRRAA
jgi:hypothetical protein